MNPEDFSRNDLVEGMSGWLSLSAAVVCAILWFGSLTLRGRFSKALVPLALTGAVLASAFFWFLFQWLGTVLSLATSWPLPAIAILGGVAVEILVGLYRFEKGLVKPGRGRLLLGLRLAALAVLILILVQPVRSFIEEREIEREVAILIDESDSMRLADQRLSASQILDRAALFGLESLRERPPLQEIAKLAEDLASRIDAEVQALQSAPSPLAGLENRAERLPEFFGELEKANASLVSAIEEARNRVSGGEVRGRLDDYLKRSRDGLGRVLPLAREAAEARKPEELLKQLEVARTELSPVLDTLPSVTVKSDETFLGGLPEERRKEIEQAAATPRIDIADRVLETRVPVKSEDGTPLELSLTSALAEKYNLRTYRFARNIEQIGGAEEEPARLDIGESPAMAQTDLTGALEHILENTSPESLAGVLLLSDGRHNGARLPEDSLRQLAVQNSPLAAVPIGGDLGPVDISLLSLKAPESIYLDDRVVVSAEAKLDGFLGEKVEAELICGGVPVDQVTIEVTDVNFRTELRFVHMPEEKGIVDYRIQIRPDEREIFQNNNEWGFKVAVTDDRTNVLLVDGYPRWEFRYLRNLFYGRDKSVHLQYVLTNPDEIWRGNPSPPVAASATRPFGDAEATELPSSPEEWQLFDVIILGDVDPAHIKIRDWIAIQEAVTRRGAMLVCIAGPRFMPHAYSSDVIRTLLPVSYTPGDAARFDSPEPAFHLELTSAGRNHPVTSQSSSRALNLERWSRFPAMSWRFVPDDIKETAEVLAYARPRGAGTLATAITPDGSPGSVEAAIERLANQESFEAENAVLSTIRAGLGKVLLLHFDQTWRFRYGVGDTYHHRFWGQVTRWGAGPNLRSGNERARLGTDRLSYTPDDSIEVTAKLLDEERRPVIDADVEVEVWKDDERIRRQRLSYRSDSSGLYETSLSGLNEEGEYELKLVGDEVNTALAADPEGPQEISTELLVVTTRNPIELAELTADRDFLNRAASVTGGKVAELHDLESLLSTFGAPREILTERHNVTLWDKWPLLAAFLGFLTFEWIVRRRSGLV